MSEGSDRTVEKLLRHQAALASFGSFAFREPDLLKVLMEAARICAASLKAPFCKIWRYRAVEGDLLVEAGWGLHPGVIGQLASPANESSPQGRAYVTGKPVIIRHRHASSSLPSPTVCGEHSFAATVDVVIPATEETPCGVLEVDSPAHHQCDMHDIEFLTSFAKMLAEVVATATRIKAMRALVEAKDLMAEELQHRVRNNLQLIASMLDDYARTTANGGARQGIDLIARRVTALAQVYDNLLGIGLSQTVDLANYLPALCVSLSKLQADRVRPVRLVCHAESVPLGLDRVTSLGMAVVELVANSYGHAFPDRNGTIVVSLARSGADSATITIQDDGVGFKIETGSARHGLGLVRRLVGQTGGTLEVQSGDGTLWTLAFPVLVPLDAAKAAA